MPRARKAPNDWPATPLNWIWMVSSGRPSCVKRRTTSLESMVPTVRFTLRMGWMKLTFSPLSSAGRAFSIRT